MIVFSSKSNFWYQFGVFLLQLHFTFAKWKIVTFFPTQNFVFKFCGVNLKFQNKDLALLSSEL